MAATCKAPKGGIISKVNGEFYEGGRFVPHHGLFCGKKGAARLAKVEKAEKCGRFFDLGGNGLYEVREHEGNGTWAIIATVRAESHRAAKTYGLSLYRADARVCLTTVEF